MQAAAEVSAELQKIDGSQPEVPHYSQIEQTVHATGQQLSRVEMQGRPEIAVVEQFPQPVNLPLRFEKRMLAEDHAARVSTCETQLAV